MNKNIKTWQERAVEAGYRSTIPPQHAALAYSVAESRELRAYIAELEAARFAYASEFPRSADGEPDTGSIHTNIRAMKKRIAELESRPAATDLPQEFDADLWAAVAQGWCAPENAHKVMDSDLATAIVRNVQKALDSRRPAAPVVAEGDEMPRSEQVLRRLLAYRCAGSNLYADDGELQDNTAHPLIDFKRDSVDTIECKLGERTCASLAAHPVAGSPAEVVHQWRQRPVGSYHPAWHDAPKDEAYERVDDQYEARTLYTRPAAAEPMPASEAPSDAEIISACHSVGVDTTPSVYGFDALQVKTSIPVLRNIINALRRAAPVPASEAASVSDALIIGIAAKSGVFATVPQVLQFGRDLLSLVAPAAPADVKPDDILHEAQQRMWTTLDRKACPGVWMQIASDAVLGFKKDSYGEAIPAAQSVRDALEQAAVGLNMAADYIAKQANDYINENASSEYETGALVWKYGDAGRDYHSALVELSEEVRALIQSPQPGEA